MQNKSNIGYFSTPKNAVKAVPYGNSPKQNSYWLMEELSKYDKLYTHVFRDHYPIFLEAKLKKNGKDQIERLLFSNIDSAVCYIKDTGLTRHRLSIISKERNMPAIIEIIVQFKKNKIIYVYRLEDESYLTTRTDIPDCELDESLFCLYSVPNGKPYKHIPYE